MSTPAPAVLSPWLYRFAVRPQARVTLVCFPHAGGGASAYQRWAALLPPSVNLLAVQYPGRQSRFGEPCVEEMGVLVDHVVVALAGVTGPVALFGHSMGALAGYEVARRLPAAAVHLLVSAAQPPAHRRVGHEHEFDDEALIAYLVGLGGEGTEALRDPGLQEILLPVVRSDLTLLAGYRHLPGPTLTCPVTALVGLSDPGATPQDARRWREATTGDFDLKILPGGHFYLDQHLERVTALVMEKLRASVPLS